MNRSSVARRRVISGLAAAVLLAALWGCAGKPPLPPSAPATKPAKPPPELFVEVRATADVNRDPAGRARPIVVRLYELRTEGAFAAADFFGLYEKETATLGPSLIAREEVTLAPGQQRVVTRLQSPEAKQLGVLAAFSEIDRARWRAVVTLTPDQDNTVQVGVGPAAVTAQVR